MSRKDTIIISVLVNAGLLIILFVSAVAFREDPAEKKGQTALGEQGQPLYQGGIVQDAKEYFASPYQGQEVVTTEVSKGGLEGPLELTAPTETTPMAQAGENPGMTIPPLAEGATPMHVLPQVSEVVAKEETSVEAPSLVEEKDSCIEMKVKKGDTLEKIARAHHTTIAEIKRINQLQTHFLRIGQRLMIPDRKGSIVTATKKHPVSENTQKFYVVKCGDNPTTIAMKHHMKVEDLLRLNHLTKEKARQLKPGARLKVR